MFCFENFRGLLLSIELVSSPTTDKFLLRIKQNVWHPAGGEWGRENKRREIFVLEAKNADIDN